MTLQREDDDYNSNTTIVQLLQGGGDAYVLAAPGIVAVVEIDVDG